MKSTHNNDEKHKQSSASLPLPPTSLIPPHLLSTPSSNSTPLPLPLPVASPLFVVPIFVTLADFSTSSFASLMYSSLPLNDFGLIISLHTGMYACTLHPISLFVTYDNLYPSYHSFALTLTGELIPQSRVDD